MSSPLVKLTAAQVDAWNQKYPPGSPGVLIKDTGQRVPVVTSSPAWLICNEGPRGLPLVKLQGFCGGWALNRVLMDAATPTETYDVLAIAEAIRMVTAARQECLDNGLMDSAAALSVAIPLLQQFRDLRGDRQEPTTALATS